MKSNSPLGKINWVDVWKTVRGMLITIGGFAIVIGGQTLAGIDLGMWNLLVAPTAAGLIEIGRRLMKDYSPVKE